MNSKIVKLVISGLFIVLGLVLTIFLFVSPSYYDLLVKIGLADKLEVETVNKDVNKYQGVGEIEYDGYKIVSYDDTVYETNMVSLVQTREFGIKKYLVGTMGFEYSEYYGNLYSNSVYYKGSLIYSELYNSGDMNLDTQFLGNNIVDYFYDDGISGIMINDAFLYSNMEGNTLSYYIDGTNYKNTVFENGLPVKDILGDTEFAYQYNGNDLLSSNNYQMISNGSSVNVIKGNNTVSYNFDYFYNGDYYLSSFKKNNDNYTVAYINDVVAAVFKNNQTYVTYVLNKDLDQVGFIYEDQIYYYIRDLNGNVFAIVDENGETAISYQYTSYGEIYSSNSLLKDINNTVINGYFYDSDTGVLCGKGKIVNPFDKTVIENGNLHAINSDFYKEIVNNLFVEKDSILAINLFYGKVRENVIFNFETEGIETASNIEFIDNNNEVVGIVDIYTLDYKGSDLSIGNIMCGNQAYQIAYNDLGEQDEMINAGVVLNNIANKKAAYYSYSYYEAPKIIKGTLEFSGQFVFLDYLISYSCNGDGIIHFTFSNNDIDNYRIYFNIYDYDNSTYVNYTENTFDMRINFQNCTTIIPGMNQEVYDVIEEYINDIRVLTSTIYQQDLRYFDDGYYDDYFASLSGDTLDLDVFDDISEENMIVLAESGDLTVKALPFYNNPRFIRNMATTTLAIGIVAFIGVYVPGLQFLIPVAVTMAKTAAFSFITSVYASATVYVINNYDEEGFFENFPAFMNQALVDASDEYVNGAAIGAISGLTMQGIKVLREFKISKTCQIKSAEAQLKLKDYSYPYMWDDPQAVREYDTLRKIAFTPREYLYPEKTTIFTRILNYKDEAVVLAKYSNYTHNEFKTYEIEYGGE